MAEQTSAADRIENALSRIEAAVKARRGAYGGLEQRHGRLRARVSEAIDAIDAMIAESEE